MSQEPPSQPPNSPEPEEKVTPQTAQPARNSFPAVLKAQTLKVLRGTIQVLEGAVEKLEAESAPTTEPSWLDKLQVGWSAALAKIRSLLPENLSAKLSDTALTGIVVGITAVLVWVTSAIATRKPPQVASVPSPEPEKPPSAVVIAPSPESEKPPSAVVIAPSPEPEKPSEVANAPSPAPVPTPSIPTPAELTAPAEPQPVEVIPPPEPEPTPEQTLIATIENQIAQISDRFADGLIQSIQVNFEGSSLTIRVGDNWYNLQPPQQDKLAAQMFQQARDLDFTRLEITDPQGTLLARSPVVGKDMVIFKRG